MEPLTNKVWEGGEKRSSDAEADGGAEGLLVSASWRGTGESLAESNRLPRRIDCHVESTAESSAHSPVS